MPGPSFPSPVHWNVYCHAKQIPHRHPWRDRHRRPAFHPVARESSVVWWRKESGGYMVTNPNCSAIGLVLALKPIEERFGIEQIFVTTMQAISGAGYPGVPSMDILGNVIPYIKSEEEKMEAETLKLLGRF